MYGGGHSSTHNHSDLKDGKDASTHDVTDGGLPERSEASRSNTAGGEANKIQKRCSQEQEHGQHVAQFVWVPLGVDVGTKKAKLVAESGLCRSSCKVWSSCKILFLLYEEPEKFY